MHFDSEIIKELTEDRNLLRKWLAVSIRINDQAELLGSPLVKGTGLPHKEAIEELLQMYEFLENIQVFDTTALNTGKTARVCNNSARGATTPSSAGKQTSFCRKTLNIFGRIIYLVLPLILRFQYLRR